MLTCELIESEIEDGWMRHDVRVEIPGVYAEVVSYWSRVPEVAHDATVEMTRARTYALSVFRKRIASAAGVPDPEVSGQTEATSRRRRRTKAEILADKAREEAQKAEVEPGTIQGTPPVEAPLGNEIESPKVDIPSDPVPESLEPSGIAIELTQEAPPVFGEPMERCPAHEAVLRNLLVENFGERWMDRPDVKSAAVMMATHAITNGVLVLDGEGKPHSQIRALFSDMVVRVCQQPA